MAETCDIPSLKKQVRNYAFAFIIACYSVFQLYLNQGRQELQALTIFIFVLIEFSLSWCAKKAKYTIKKVGGPRRAVPVKIKTQSQARLVLVGVFLC